MEREGCRVCKYLNIPGICFNPSDEELLAYYLKSKIEERPLECNHLMTELKIYDDAMMPWEVLKDDNPYWITSSSDSWKTNKIKKTIYVFTELRKKKSRVIRRSGRGSWTGQNNPFVQDKAGDDIGYNKLLTFYEDNDDKKGKKGKKKMITDDQDHGNWIMHEYSLFGIDKYVLCKIIKEVRINTTATQDFRTQRDAEIMNVVSDDERQLGGGDQTLDESTTDWDKNGWMKELYHELGENISDVQELAIDGQEDIFMDNPQQGQDILDFSLGETVAQELPVAVCGKNGQRDGSYKGLDGAGNHDIIILDDDSCTGVHDVQELMMIEAADAPRIQAINGDDQQDNSMEGNKQIIDDFWNFELAGADRAVSPTNTAWDGLDDVILDFSSPELSDLWGDEIIEQSCSIFEGHPEKRMRCGVEDYEECPSGKKQRCL